MRRKPNLETRLEKCSVVHIAEPELYRGNWLDTFPHRELHVELGCGKGLFTVETAKAEPGILLVALEKTANVMVIAMERTIQAGLQNVRFLNMLADDLCDCFAPDEVARLYINFCDPWPANRHVKRRLTGEPFLTLYKQILRSGSEIHFKTDDLTLFEFSLCEFKRCGFSIIDEVRDLHKNGPAGIMTDYELKFYEQGVPIYMCVVQK